ncbi:RNA methyltransferase [Bdellovibrio bacteriovorus]|uniref:RNA methyltransferase n=1 Tax=Bdellovibrio bacteriovorus TaxID=959 RepID=UPI0021D001A1|nr:RNA methyltransferase [Bdellovibrio bacteriovorus]UXR63760.1 RNA methyltransferase [Bdellovibrio bacteriovorus]
MSLSAQDKKSLEEIHQLFLKLEKSSGDFSFEASALKELKAKILALSASGNPDVSRLSPLEKHLTDSMTLKHFVSYSIPFERLLHKNLQDDEFLVIENDKDATPQEKLPLVFVLDNIRSAFNVGSIFRTAECLGASKIYLCGYTPLPTQWKVEKTAMGTQEYLEWEEAPKLLECLEELKDEGYRIVALETAASATDLYEAFDMEPTAFVLGNERFGLDPEVLKVIDEVRIIPLRGRKNSLNVGVTAAVAGFEWLRQWRQK